MLKHLFLLFLTAISMSSHADMPKVKIGVVGPFTGASSTDMGSSIRGGARVFADEIRNFSVVLGKEIELVEMDDEANPEVGLAAVKALVEKEQVVAVVGFANIAVATKVADYLQKAGIPLIVSAAAGGDITRRTLQPKEPNYIFRVSGRDSLQTLAMMKDLVERRKLRSIAILHDTTPYGEGGRQNAVAELERRGLKAVAIESFKVGDQDMTAQLARARDAGAQAIAVYGLATEDAMVARSLARMNWNVPLVGTWTMSQNSYLELAGRAAEGSRAAVTFIEDERGGVTRTFGISYRKVNKTQVIPSGVAAAQTYDALRLLYLALYQCSCSDPQGVRKALDNLQYSARSTVVTRYDRPFTPDDHEAISANMVVMGEIRNGKFFYAYKEDENASLITRVKEIPEDTAAERQRMAKTGR